MNSVKFNFSLPKDEAELLLDVIREAARKSRFDAILRPDNEKEWLLAHSQVIDNMANTIAKGSSKC